MALSGWRGRWKGRTAWIIGSSAAWQRLDPRFFDDKDTIALNYVGPTFGLSDRALTVTQYAYVPDELREKGWWGTVFAPDRKIQGGPGPEPQYESDVYTVRDLPPPSLDFDPFLKHWPAPDEDRLFHGTTTLHMAMSLAWYLGCASLITVAADHGYWNGNVNGAGYYETQQEPATKQFIDSGWWLRHTDELAAHLRSLGMGVYTLLPAVNANGEGLSFKGPRATIG